MPDNDASQYLGYDYMIEHSALGWINSSIVHHDNGSHLEPEARPWPDYGAALIAVKRVIHAARRKAGLPPI